MSFDKEDNQEEVEFFKKVNGYQKLDEAHK
jgi:hypothetical protein